jgi:hypothetical protein
VDTTSASTTAAGLLALFQNNPGVASIHAAALRAVTLLSDITKYTLSPRASFTSKSGSGFTRTVDLGGFDTIVMNGTLGEGGEDRGVVWTDFYFLEAGNTLLEVEAHL